MQVQRIALRFKLDRYVLTQLKLHVNSLKNSDTSLKSILSLPAVLSRREFLE